MVDDAAASRAWCRSAAVIAAMVVARLVAVAGITPYLYVDSAEYEVLDFSGRWRRPWATPYLYWLVPDGHRGEQVAQAVVGGVAWGVLALAAVALFDDRRVGVVVGGAVAALGLTSSVTNWDTAILSESLALSFTALVLAAWLHLVRRSRWSSVGLVVIATFPWLFVRQSLLPTAAMVVAVTAIAAAVSARRRGDWRKLAAVAAALFLLTGLAAGSYSRNQEVVRTNLTVIVANRVAPNAARLAWFRRHGMPRPPSGGLDYPTLEADPSFQGWVAGEGRTTYVEYLVTHPWYTLTEPLDDLISERRSYLDEPVAAVTMLSPADSYGSAHPVIPEVAEQVLFDPGATGTVLSALAVVVALSVLRRRRRDRRWVLTFGLIGICLASLVAGWHGAAPELNRLAIVAAIGLRVGLLLQLGLLAEGWLRSRGDLRAAS